MTNDVTKNIYLLIAAQCINKVYDIFFGMFLVSFLFKQTKENVADIGIYHFVCYLTIAFLAYLTGNWIKRGNRLLMYQLGIILTFLFFVGFIFLQNRIVHYIPYCGLAFGLIVSFKAFPSNLIIADNIPASKMIAFKGYMESLKNIIRIASPLVLGIFLTTGSYFKTVGFLAFLSVVEFIIFTQIKVPAKKGLPPFNIKSFWQRTRNYKYLKHLYKIEFCRGMTVDGTLETLITLYIIYLFKTDFNLGLISSIFYGLTILLNLVFGRYCKYKHFSKILVMIAALIISSVTIFLFFPGKATFIFYNFCFIVVTQFLRIIADIYMFNVSNLRNIIGSKSEYFVTRELFLNLGRLISYSLLFMVGMVDNFSILKYLLLFLTLFVALMCLSAVNLNEYLIGPDSGAADK